MSATSITCPKCGRTSWHPDDVRMGYCGACHAVTTWQLSDAQAQLFAALVTAGDAHAVLWHFGSGGYEPGDFTKALVEVIVRADPANRACLALGFPGLVSAVQLAQGRLDGIARLQAIAEGRR